MVLSLVGMATQVNMQKGLMACVGGGEGKVHEGGGINSVARNSFLRAVVCTCTSHTHMG